MTTAHVLPLALFMLIVLAATTFALAASGHFPAAGRLPAFRTRAGIAVLWGTIAAAVLAVMLALAFAARALPWPAAVIGAGIMMLVAPLVLNLFPDEIVDGTSGLLAFAGIALAIAVVACAAAL